jgi:hypothetical protein
MLKWIIAAVSLIPAIAYAKPVALDAPTRNDVRCVVALSRAAGEEGAESPEIPRLQTITFYYIGRIDGRTPKLDIGAAFEQEGRQMSHADYQRLPQLCQDEYGRRADALNTAARAMPD